MTTPQEAYETYAAVTAYFRGKYDFSRYGGRMRLPDVSTKSDYYRYKKLAEMGYDSLSLAVASHFARHGPAWVGDFVASEEARSVALGAIAYAQSGAYRLEEDLLNLTHDRFNDNFTGDPPQVLRDAFSGRVTVEGAAAIDGAVGFTGRFLRVEPNDPLAKARAERIRAYATFVGVPRETVRRSIVKIFEGGTRGVLEPV